MLKLASNMISEVPMKSLPRHGMRHRLVQPMVCGIFALLLSLLLPAAAKAQSLQFSSLEDLLAYSDARSAVARGADVQTDLARLQSAAAIANTVNLRGTASLTATNNFALPVNFIPAEIFGGPSGTFREVTFGQQFVNVANVSPQLDLVAPSTWARVGSARASAALTATTNALNRRDQHERIATAYFNFRSAEAQQAYAQQTLANADSIVALVGRRHAAGIARVQDLNNARVNRASLVDFLSQLQTRQAQHLLSLQALLGMPATASLLPLPANAGTPTASSEPAGSRLLQQQAELQASLQRSELLANRLAFLPTLSVVAGFNWQQNSNESMFNSAKWIRSQYVGLKLSVPLPTETRLWSQAEEYRINLRMKTINAEQVAVQESIQNQQQDLELARAAEALVAARSIAELKQENYRLSSLNYAEGILPLDQMLTAFTDWLNAGLNAEVAQWNVALQQTKVALLQ